MTETFSGKDMEGILQAMVYICRGPIFRKVPHAKMDDVYFVLQGPRSFLDRFIYLNSMRPKIHISNDPNNAGKKGPTSKVFFSNIPEHPGEFKLNVHYGSLRISRTSNLLFSMKFPLPDFGKLRAENTLNTAFEDPDADKVNAILRNMY